MKIQILLMLSCCFMPTAFSQHSTEIDFKKHFDAYGVNGCFVLYDQANDETILYNAARCDSGFIPASTFKIPNSLIALEEGIIKDTSQVIPWDGTEHPIKAWNQDQTLKTALQYSCVWVYVDFARQIGIETYRDYLEAFDYGNLYLTGPADRFWLVGPYRITAREQVNFLRKFYHGELGVSDTATNYVKAILIRDTGEDYTLSAKTGSGYLSESEMIMWLVGYLEKDDHPYFFALNYTGKAKDWNKFYIRNNILKGIFQELGVMWIEN